METQQSWNRLATVAVLALGVVAVGFVLHTLSGILLPFVLAGFLSMVFRPLVHVLRGWRIPLPLVLLAVMVVSASSLWLIYFIISLGVDQFNASSGFYLSQLKSVMTTLERAVANLLSMMGARGPFKFERLLTPEAATTFATGQLSMFLSLLSDGVMVLLYLLFMLSASEAFPTKIKAAFVGPRGSAVLEIFESLNKRVRTYLAVKTAFNLANGIIAWGILELFGVDFAPLIGLLTFLFHYIPNIGSIVTTLIPGVVYLLQTGSLGHAGVLVLVLVVVQNIIGNVIEPKVLGDRLELSPVVVLFSLLFWGWMWGIVGMILSVPIMSSLKVLLEMIPATRPLGILMGSAPQAAQAKTIES